MSGEEGSGVTGGNVAEDKKWNGQEICHVHIPGLFLGFFFSLDLLQSGCLTCSLPLATESPENKSGEQSSGVTEEIVVEDGK